MTNRQDFIISLKNFFSVDYIIPVGGGLVGIYSILKALNIKNKYVIVPAITGWTVPIAIEAAGGYPLLVDVSIQDLNLTIDGVHSAIQNYNVGAIISVNNFGYPANIKEIKSITEGLNIPVIEDACQSYGGELNNEKLGARGDLGIFSFGYGKPLEDVGGGFILTNNKEYYEKIKEFTDTFYFKFLSDKKNQIKVKLVLSGRWDLLRHLSIKTHLIRYSFPEKTWRNINIKWKHFINEITSVRDNLMAISDILTSLKGVSYFNYNERKWLPWRLSFIILNQNSKLKFEHLAKQQNLHYSNLYRPLNYYFKDLKIANKIPNAIFISEHIYNLVYQTNYNSTSSTLKKVKNIKTRWH